ncbi:MAG: hypothetical protein LKJ25_09020 [Clostridia bacterium]|jgi:DNA-binding transcriptional ArsR family regulator|nr:hypothetical protein [Clostridia bacterium]
MEEKDIKNFDKMVESLRLYRRYELVDNNNNDLLDKVYVDPIDNDGILNLCLKDNTTVLVGRKGTGKSTILMRMQNELRKSNTIMTCYIDVKNVFDNAKRNYTTINYLNANSNEETENYSIQRQFILDFLSELIVEVNQNYNSFLEKLRDKFHLSKPKNAIRKLNEIKKNIKNNEHLKDIELQTIQSINMSNDSINSCKKAINGNIEANLSSQAASAKIGGQNSIENITENEKQYNRIFARIFEITNIVNEIKSVLQELSLKRLYLILDDYSEIDQISLSMFCNLVVNCLNNNSDNFIKLKISAYPGRVELGELDPQKIDIRYLDYYQLYVNDKRSEMEDAAIDYTKRIIEKRLMVFTGKKFEFFFDTEKTSVEEYCKLIFYMSMNVVRHIGLILDYAREYSVIHGDKITKTNLTEASKRLYTERLRLFFDESTSTQMTYDERVEIFQLRDLLGSIINREKEIKRDIISNNYTAKIFDSDRKNPFTSHFAIAAQTEYLLGTLELNFFVSKYNEMSNKSGKKVAIYALNYGLCVDENLRWGKPDGNMYRTYFIETPFNFNSLISGFIKETRLIKCKNCGSVFEEIELPYIEKYGYNCPKCLAHNSVKVEKIVSDDDRIKIENIEKQGNLLDKEQYTFLKIAIIRGGKVFASDMAQEMDMSKQKIGWLTKKLEEEYYYIAKSHKKGKTIYNVTKLAIRNIGNNFNNNTY